MNAQRDWCNPAKTKFPPRTRQMPGRHFLILVLLETCKIKIRIPKRYLFCPSPSAGLPCSPLARPRPSRVSCRAVRFSSSCQCFRNFSSAASSISTIREVYQAQICASWLMCSGVHVRCGQLLKSVNKQVGGGFVNFSSARQEISSTASVATTLRWIQNKP